jgi:hypothetical protein
MLTFFIYEIIECVKPLLLNVIYIFIKSCKNGWGSLGIFLAVFLKFDLIYTYLSCKIFLFFNNGIITLPVLARFKDKTRKMFMLLNHTSFSRIDLWYHNIII